MTVRAFVDRVRFQRGLRELARNSGTLYAGGAVAVALTGLQQVLTAKGLSAAGYGQMATALGFVLLAMLFVDVRTWELATRVLVEPIAAKDGTEVARSFSRLLLAELLVGGAGSIVVAAAAVMLPSSVVDPDLATLLVTLSPVIPCRLVTTGASVALVRMFANYRAISTRSVMTALARLLLIAAPAVAGWDVAAVAVGVVVSEGFAALAMAALAAHELAKRFEVAPFDLSTPRCQAEALRIAPSLWVSASIKGVHLETFIPLGAVFTSAADIGTLRAGLDMAQLSLNASAPLSIVMAPKIISLCRNATAAELGSYLRMTKWVFGVVAVAIALLSAALISLVLPRILGDQYAEIHSVGLVLLAGAAFQTATQWVRPVLVGVDRVARQNLLGIAGGAVSVGALPFSATHFGAVGAAANMAVFMVLYTSISARLADRSLRSRVRA